MIKIHKIITINTDFINNGNNQLFKDKFGRYFINHNLSFNDLVELQCEPQQILILSDDKPNINDKIISISAGTLNKILTVKGFDKKQYFVNEYSFSVCGSKIIASYPRLDDTFPSINIHFIKDWIKNPKELVAVEYDNIRNSDDHMDRDYSSKEEIKLTSNNKIIITNTKDYVYFTTLTKEEVEKDRCSVIDYLIKLDDDHDIECYCDECEEKENKRILERAKHNFEALNNLEKAAEIYLAKRSKQGDNLVILRKEAISALIDFAKSDLVKNYWLNKNNI